mgnify:FL=1
MIKKLLVAALAAVALTGCNDDATIASQNLSKAANQFEIDRRIVFYNGITDKYILSIEGKCSIDTSRSGATFFVTCKTGHNQYKKHFLGLSDNVTFFAEQLESANVSAYHYRVIFKPQSILPDIEFKGDVGELKGLVR